MFRFTIRELLLFTLVVALGLGWGLERRRSEQFRSELALSQMEIQSLQAAVTSFYRDIEQIRSDLPAHGLTLVRSKATKRQSVQKLEPTNR